MNDRHLVYIHSYKLLLLFKCDDNFIWDLALSYIRSNFLPSPDNTTFIFLFPRRDIMTRQKKNIWSYLTISICYTSWDCLLGDKVGQHIVSSALLFSNKPTWLVGQGKTLDGPLITNSSTRKTTVQF